ncbi:ElaA protein [Longimycelium tulufanense]|uniref:ElaA protein n=1 Tax=Longimycelium tulufanense TaxID=907463 RepID=A0A8J3CAF1_9PSEU|nr:GNAT family N-acetyltransferase [Longimycelium tulufanense]GGM38955.1 ElaA protein [Longimycelium tulufanense]
MTESPGPPPATLHVATPDQLTVPVLHALLRLRVDVFVVDQKCPYHELDGRDLDPDTRHLWVSSPQDPTDVLAYLRVVTGPEGTCRIARVVTAERARGRGLARELMRAALDLCGSRTCELDAQTYVADFYAGLGFVAVGEQFLEDGIPHVHMRREGRRDV